MKQIRVTVEDLETGEKESKEISDDYILVTAGRCEVAALQAYGNGTHVVTIKHAGGVAYAIDRLESPEAGDGR